MIIYRPYGGGLAESLAESKEFEAEEEMKQYIFEHYKSLLPGLVPFEIEDIVIDGESVDDDRCGWHDTRYVCVKRMGDEIYDCPQCIGMCATDYEKLPEEEIAQRINNMR